MRYIANILTQGSFPDKDFYNVVDKKENLIKGIPTLVIGWKFVLSQYPNASILSENIDEHTLWCFGSREKRNKYEESITKFRKESLEKFVKSIRYHYISLLTASKEEKIKINDTLTKCDNVKVYINNDIIYIYSCLNDEVIGISLKDIDYEGKDRRKIFAILYHNQNIEIIDIKDKLSFEMKQYLNNYNYVIPYLYS